MNNNPLKNITNTSPKSSPTKRPRNIEDNSGNVESTSNLSKRIRTNNENVNSFQLRIDKFCAVVNEMSDSAEVKQKVSFLIDGLTFLAQSYPHSFNSETEVCCVLKNRITVKGLLGELNSISSKFNEEHAGLILDAISNHTGDRLCYSPHVLDIFTKIGLKTNESTLDDIRTLVFSHADASIKYLQMYINCAERNLEGIDFSYYNLSGIDFTAANMTHTTLSSCYVDKGTNFSNADFSDANLSTIRFNGANLTHAKFEGANICGADFSGVIFPPDQVFDIRVALNKVNFIRNFRQNLNHLIFPESKSWLSAINSIPDNSLKIRLMNQLLEHIQLHEIDIREVLAPLRDILLNDPVYLKNETTYSFIMQLLLTITIPEANINRLIFTNTELGILLDHLLAISSDKQQEFILNNNGCFVQLINQARHSDDETIKSKGMYLCDECVTNYNSDLTGFTDIVSNIHVNPLKLQILGYLVNYIVTTVASTKRFGTIYPLFRLSVDGILDTLQNISSDFTLEHAQSLLMFCTLNVDKFEYANSYEDEIIKLGINADWDGVLQLDNAIQNNHIPSQYIDIYVNCADWNLSRLDLRTVQFPELDLQDVNFSHSQMSGFTLVGSNFSGAIFFEHQQIYLSSFLSHLIDNKQENPEWFIENFNALLMSINSIDNAKYTKLKINLFIQIISWISKNKFDVNEVFEPLRSVLLNDRVYLHNNKDIEKFIYDELIPLTLGRANSGKMEFTNLEGNILLGDLNYCTDEQRLKFMFDNNGCFIQLLHQCRNSNNQKVKIFANNLYQLYLSDNRISGVTKLLIDLDEDLKDLVIFFNQSSQDALAVYNSYIDKYLYEIDSQENKQLTWSSLYWYHDHAMAVIGGINLSNLFTIFPVFSAYYTFCNNNAKIITLLDCLDLGEYKDSFINALKNKDSTIKYCGNTLNHIFNALLDTPDACSLHAENAQQISLTESHFKRLMDLLELHGKSIRYQAVTLLSMAGVFAIYSSSYIFGVEDDSPVGIRYYVYALMKKAIELDDSIMSSEKYKDCVDRLLGIGENTFTCTAVLSGIVLELCNGLDSEITKSIMPPTWQ